MIIKAAIDCDYYCAPGFSSLHGVLHGKLWEFSKVKCFQSDDKYMGEAEDFGIASSNVWSIMELLLCLCTYSPLGKSQVKICVLLFVEFTTATTTNTLGLEEHRRMSTTAAGFSKEHVYSQKQMNAAAAVSIDYLRIR